MGRFHAVTTRLSAVLAVSLTLCGTAPGFADDILVPRLGYPTLGPKRVYMDITTPAEAKEENKEDLEKAREDEGDTHSKRDWVHLPHRHHNTKPVTATPAASTAGTSPSAATTSATSSTANTAASTPPDSPATDDAATTPPSTASTAPAKPLTKAQRVELAHKRAQAAHYAHYKKVADERKASHKHVAVFGEAYLINLKDGQLLYHEGEKIKPDTDIAALAPYYVQFKENPR